VQPNDVSRGLVVSLQIFAFNFSEESLGYEQEIRFGQLDFVSNLILQDGLRGRLPDRFIRAHDVLVVQHRIAQHAYLVQWIAVFSFQSP
jgi:hypothetical protein